MAGVFALEADSHSILAKEFPKVGLLVLDALHKNRKWRQLLKGFYDKNSNVLRILVIGSARLDYYRFGGDSLQGRYHYLRMHPLSVKELVYDHGGNVESFLPQPSPSTPG